MLQAHAKALRGHVDSLAAKAYWSAFATTPEMVLCFVPGDAVLAAALAADPELYEYAQRSRVVLSSPATLLAVLRAVAFTWQQDALASNARELLSLGADLYERLGTLAGHVDGMGRAVLLDNPNLSSPASLSLCHSPSFSPMPMASLRPPTASCSALWGLTTLWIFLSSMATIRAAWARSLCSCSGIRRPVIP